jgi:hypothetical protein
MYCRPGKYQFAIEHLNMGIHLRKGEAEEFVLYVLAMSYHPLGDAALAGDSYGRALHSQAQVKLTPQMLGV